MLPLGRAPAWGGHSSVRSFFKSKRSQSPRPGERFLLGLVGLPGMCVLFLQEIPSESPAGVSRATGACGSAPPARIVPAPLCWPLYCHRPHPMASTAWGCPCSSEGSPCACPAWGTHGHSQLLSLPCCPQGSADDTSVPLVTLSPSGRCSLSWSLLSVPFQSWNKVINPQWMPRPRHLPWGAQGGTIGWSCPLSPWGPWGSPWPSPLLSSGMGHGLWDWCSCAQTGCGQPHSSQLG